MQDATRRRLLLVGGLAAFAGAWQVVPRIYDKLSSDFDFEALEQPAGFRRIRSGEISAPLDVFAGLDDGPGPDLTVARAAISSDLQRTLFYAKTNAAFVQVAYFSDFYCPICRVISSELIALMGDMPIEVSWHETPIFGPPSDLAARAAIAASGQDAYVPFHDLLVSRPVVVTRPYLRELAVALGLDVDQFEADQNSTDTQSMLNRAAALAELFGFVGTPAMVVGKTVVQGRISATNLRQLIELEARDLA